MQRFRDNILIMGSNGLIPYAGSSVAVYLAGTSTLASIYPINDPASAKENPFRAGDYGEIDFYAQNGRYDLLLTRQGYQSLRITDLQIWDPANSDFVTDVDVDGMIAGKADKTYVDSELLGKADITYVDQEVAGLIDDVTPAEDKTYSSQKVSTDLAAKVNTVDLANDTDPAKGAGQVGYRAPYDYAVPETARDVLRDVVSVKRFGAKLDGTTNDFTAFQRAASEGISVEVPPGGQAKIIALEPIVLATGASLYMQRSSGTTLQVDGDSPALFSIENARCNIIGLVAENAGSVGKFISRTTNVQNDFTFIENCRVALFQYGVYSETGISGAFTVQGCRFNQVDYPFYNADGGVNYSIINNYMLGCLAGVSIHGPGQQSEGVTIFRNTILPNKPGGIGIHITSGLALAMLDNMIDQVGAGGTGIFLDAPDGKIEDVTSRNLWVGVSSSGASYGIRAVGDVRNLNIEDDAINGFAKNISLESLGAGKTVLYPLVAPKHLRPGASPPIGQTDIYIDGAQNVRYGTFESLSEVSLYEESNVTVAHNAGFSARGQVKRAQQAVIGNEQIYFVGTRKSSPGAAIGNGFFIAGNVIRVMIPYSYTARRAATGIAVSDVAHLKIRHGGGTVDVASVALNASTDTSVTLDITTSTSLTSGEAGMLYFTASEPDAWIAVL